MANIKITDLEPMDELSDDELGEVVGGFSLMDSSTMYDAWTPTTTSSFQLKDPSYTMYDAWHPPG